MNTPPPPLGMVHSLTSTTYPTAISNTSTPSKRRNVCAASGTQDFPIIEEPHETQFSQDIDTPSDDFYQVHQTRHHEKPTKPLSGFQRDHAKKNNLSTQETL